MHKDQRFCKVKNLQVSGSEFTGLTTSETSLLLSAYCHTGSIAANTASCRGVVEATWKI